MSISHLNQLTCISCLNFSLNLTREIFQKMRTIAFLVVILAAVCVHHSANAMLDIDIDMNPRPFNRYAEINRLAGKCSKTAGCYKNYCWAYCGSTELSSGKWCYTTQAASNSLSYVPCMTDEECNTCWNCGGGCGY